MKLLMENWRKYLNEAVSPGNAAMIAREVLQKVINKENEDFYPYPEKEVLGNDTLETFLRREAQQSRGRASDVFKSLQFFQGGYPDDEGRVKDELDALEVLLQLALKGKTYRKHKDELEASRIRYGYKDLKGQQISGEPDDTQMFIPKESIIRENQNLSEKEKTVLKAEALLAFISNMKHHEGIEPADIKKLKVEDPEKLENYIITHNRMIDNKVLLDFIRSF